MRPANLFTAVADIAAGFAISANLYQTSTIWTVLQQHAQSFILLCLATVGLYGGGVVFNDIFDLKLDAVERPERPLPSGKVSQRNAILLGLALLMIGISAALFVGFTQGIIACAIAGLALLYDKYGKHHSFWGPINMASCRALNLLLGISIFGLQSIGFIPIILPFIFIASITLISRGEVWGGTKSHFYLAFIGYASVIVFLLGLHLFFSFNVLYALPFITLFAAVVLPPLWKAQRSLAAKDIKSAVISGVLSLVILDAALAAGFSNWTYGLCVLCLLAFSIGLGKLFAIS